MKKCKVCKNEFFKEPLLIYRNMPSISQNLPTEKSLNKDKGIKIKVYQCSGCGLIQINNKPVSYYKEVIRASGLSKEMNEFRLKEFQEFVKKYSLKNKKIIEIGCGKGEYLSLMQGLEVDVYGIEENQESVDICIKKGLKVKKGFIEKKNCKIDNSPFDAFLILSFLEHIPNINLVLRGIYNNLKEESFGIVEVPNFDMILNKRLFSEFTRDHLYYFTKETLKTTLELNGFEVIEIKEIWYDYIISAIVRKRKLLNIEDFHNHEEKIKKDIYEYIKKFGNKKVAIWGAGHQAFAIMSLFKLKNKIKYVIDSAKFKQDKYTPVTHIPIVSPETLDINPVDAIIVIAAGYSNEIAEIIKQKYNNKMNIAILKDYGLEIY
ncbi:MAG: class I SAM-dependent methyltransferase [Candidatus Pacearchaeota archaeon]